MKDYCRYWAKTPREAGECGAACHLLPYHNLDVAAVAQVILRRDMIRTRRIAAALDLDPEQFIRFFVFSLALHDVGKFARAFQGLAHPDVPGLVAPEPRMVYEGKYKHDALGAHLWAEHLWPDVRSNVPELANLGVGDRLRAKYALASWMAPIFGHHGKPVDANDRPLARWFVCPDDPAAASAFLHDATDLLAPHWPRDHLVNKEWRETCLVPQTWELAGLAVACDWLGSNSADFRYRFAPLSLDEYWHGHALPSAELAVTASGLVDRSAVAAFPGFRETYGFRPTPLQAWAESVELPAGPQMFLLEDVTGSGKTEAALTLAHRLMEAGHARGLYFGLPTMATSNAMHARVGQRYHGFFEPGENPPSLVLAHGSRHLSSVPVRLFWPDQPEEAPYSQEDEGGSVACNAWLGDNRKKALLAEVGVGTIDQALLGILPRKHQSLRLLGLADKVLLIDEVHAYDPYTATLLERLLEAHARQGGSAILLSATVPHVTRAKLLAAWYRGRNGEGPALREDRFPLVTHAADDAVGEQAIDAAPSSERFVGVEFIQDEQEVAERMLAAARDGRCACWVRNTVDDAIRAYQWIRAQTDWPEKVVLFHARFAMGDRQRIEDAVLQAFGLDSGPVERAGRILIATQVVEQSLDIDFDVLISDLAPIELLIQRAGRLHRHPRRNDGARVAARGEADQRPSPVLGVLAPAWDEAPAANWLRGALPGTSYVYPDAAQLWLGCRILRECGGIHLPDQARRLLEGVYGDDVDIPEGLDESRGESYATERAHASAAGYTALDLQRGYSRDAARGGWDDEQEAGTRLSDEPSVRVVLLRRADDGSPQPWFAGQEYAWSMSAVQLRKSLADQVANVPAEWDEAVEQLRTDVRALKFVQFWAPDEIAPGSYSPELGVGNPRRREQEPNAIS